MRVYAVHAAPPPPPASVPTTLRPGRRRAPRLVPEGFSWPAFFLGPLWLAWRGCWLAALATLAASLAIGFAEPDAAAMWPGLALQLLIGFEGRDLWRRRLARGGLPLRAVVAAPDAETAWFRLARERPDLVADVT